MASSIYTNFVSIMLGGDFDFVNDRLSAIIVDTSVYTPDIATDTVISDIPEEAILSETLVQGKYVDATKLMADDLYFTDVATELIGSAIIIIFKDEDTTVDSFLCFYFDSDDFPVEADGADITAAWPIDGLVVITIEVI